MYEIGDPVPETCTIPGKLKPGETGFSHSCGYHDAIHPAKQKSRELRADAVRVTKVTNQDFISTCYRVEAAILERKEKPAAAASS